MSSNGIIIPATMVVAFVVLYYFLGFLFSFLIVLLAGYVFLFSDFTKLKNKVLSVEVGESRRGEGRIRRNNKREKALLTELPGGVRTLFDVFQHSAKKYADSECYGTRVIGKDGEAGDFQWQKYGEINKRTLNFGSGLMNIGLKPDQRVGFYAENRADWMIAAHACEAFSLTSVSIYDTLGEENRVFIVQQSKIVCLITKRAHFKNILDLSKHCPALKHVILFESDITDEERKKSADAGLKIHSFKEVEDNGSDSPQKPIPPSPEDLAIIMYTSGTTSQPKGVLITHANLVSTVAGVMDSAPLLNSNDVYLSYLPLAHILERAVVTTALYHGARIGFFQGNIRKLDSDLMTLRPTLFAGVPKVFQRLMNGVQAKVAKQPAVNRTLFALGVSLKRILMARGLPTGLIDRIVFGKVTSALGGRVRLMMSGGAPFGEDCHEFIRICFGCPVMQGYGLTETCGGCSITPYDIPVPYKRAGPPIGSCEVKLVDSGVYSSSNNPPQGEVCISGPSVTKGYYEMPEKTAADFRPHADGRTWFHTGDVGQWNEDGTLSIIGRTKDIFKLDSGEYVAPERLEGIYAQSKYVGNIFVYGESNRSFLVAVIVPDQAAALHWAEENKVEVSDNVRDAKAPNCPPSLCKNAAFKKAIMDDLKLIGQKSKLNRFEDIVNVHLDSQFWMPDGGLVTDALKNKRPVLEKHFKAELAQLYKDAPTSSSS